MKKDLLLIFIIFFLTSCGNEIQDKSRKETINQIVEKEPANQQSDEFAHEAYPSSSTILNTQLINANKEKIICMDQDISEWYGFKEQDTENAQCKLIKNYKITHYECEKRLAFEEGLEAMFVLAPKSTIISYAALDKCNAAKEIWESNAP